MSARIYHFEIKELLDEFHKDIVSVRSHNYRLPEIIRMIVNSYRNNNTDEIQYIGRFCMYYSEAGDQPAIDSHIMLNAILRLRDNIFRLLNNFTLVNQKNENNQFPYKMKFHSLNNDHLLIEVECIDYGSLTL